MRKHVASRLAGWAYALVLLLVITAGGPAVAGPADPPSAVAATTPSTLPVYLRDRGTGVPTSMFGTYIRKGELIVYPFFEYYLSNSFEYSPEEIGFEGVEDYRGRYRASEGLIFVSYGAGEDVSVEIEAAVIKASLEKSAADSSAAPPRTEASGLGDVEGQLRWRWKRENERRPELFSYFEAVLPHAGDKVLIGTPGWELGLGTGVTKGYAWGTLTARAALEYAEASSSPFDLGECAVEYLKRLSPSWRLYLGLEGTPDELSLITEVQWHPSDRVAVRLNSGFGLTSKATDWAPEVGIVFRFPTRRSVQASTR